MYRTHTLRNEQKVLLPPTGVKVWPDKIDGKEQPEPTDPSQAWRKKQRRVTVGLPMHRMLSMGQLLAGVAGAWATVLLLFLAWWKPHMGMTGGATGLGMMVGMLYTYLYYKNVRAKQEFQQVVSNSGSWRKQRDVCSNSLHRPAQACTGVHRRHTPAWLALQRN
jgi:hypothetical protein